MIKSTNNTSVEIKLAARVVQGLLLMNESNHRKDVSKDTVFIKALLIATCTLKTIYNLKENQTLPKSILSFIKGKQLTLF